MKTRLEGFQKPSKIDERKTGGLARIAYGGSTAVCSCGWSCGHLRSKVLDAKIDKHVEKYHGGRAIYL